MNGPIISDWNADAFKVSPSRRGGHGLVDRDYTTHPTGYLAGAEGYRTLNFPTIPMSKWPEWIKAKQDAKSNLSDIRMTGGPNGGMIPSLDQNGEGYCWNYSVTMAIMMKRAVMGEPYVRLSGHANAWMIKGGRDEGGWGALGLERAMKAGSPSVEFWPEKSMSGAHNNAQTWANAMLHIVPEGWVDLDAAAYDRKMTWEQFGTLLLCNCPCAADYNHLGHSICILDVIEAGSVRGEHRDPDTGKLLDYEAFRKAWDFDGVGAGFGVKGVNSYSDGWGDRGFFTLSGSRAIPNGAVAPRTTMPSIT